MWRVVIATIVGVALLVPAPGSGGPEQPATLAVTRGGDVFAIRADGTGLRPLLRRAYAPAWSPDGTRLAFVSRRSGDEEIYVANADGGGVRRLTRSPGADLSPAWSSDGTRIAWSRNGEIWTMAASGANQRAVVRKAKRWHEHVTPAWHGTRLVYSSTRAGFFNPELYAAPAVRLTHTKGSDGVLGDDGMPDFSPDGRRIVFTSNRDQQAEIYVMNRDGSGERRLLARRGDDFLPRFSGDGTQIAFVSLPGTIVVANADGTGARRLTAGTDADWKPLP
jgi:Tol biopolymer transport system component